MINSSLKSRMRCRVRNWRLVTIVFTSVSKRYPPEANFCCISRRVGSSEGCKLRPSAYDNSLRPRVSRKSFLALLVNEVTQPRHARALYAAGKRSAGVHRFTAQIFAAEFADWPVAFKDQPIGVETRMTSRTGRICAMFRQSLPQRQIAQFAFICRKGGNIRRRRRDRLAQQTAHHPVAALHGAGTQAGGVFRQGTQPSGADRRARIGPHLPP